MPEEMVRTFGADAVYGRKAHPVEIAPPFVSLASSEARFVTEEIYGVTGGLLIDAANPPGCAAEAAWTTRLFAPIAVASADRRCSGRRTRGLLTQTHKRRTAAPTGTSLIP